VLEVLDADRSADAAELVTPPVFTVYPAQPRAGILRYATTGDAY